MAASSPFIVIEMPGLNLPGTGLTARNPGVTLDTMTERHVVKGKEVLVPMLFMMKGARGPVVDEFVERFSRVGRVETLRHDAQAEIWIGRGVLRESAVEDPGLQALMQFQDRFGAPWAHSEGGIIHLRAVVNEPREADRLVHQMRGYFAEHDVDAQVELQEFSPHDYSVWDDLVQYSLGLHT